MSIGPSVGGILSSAAGSHLPQVSGSDKQKAGTAAADQAKQAESNRQAEKSEGVGETPEDQKASDRDADGRRLWEEQTAESQADTDQTSPETEEHKSRDASGDRGNRLDLSG